VRAVSDLHGQLPEIAPCDVLVLAGDLADGVGGHQPRQQARWLDGRFRAWLERLDVGHVIAIAGNHDFWGLHPELVPELPWTYLRDCGAEVAGLSVYGTPWTPTYGGGWAFEADDDQLAAVFSRIPSDLDVLVCHSPPWGYGDAVPDREWDWQRKRFVGRPPRRHLGSDALLSAIDRGRPGLVVFGHVHEGRGCWQRDDTVLANVTALDETFHRRYPAMAFEFDPRHRPAWRQLSA
jgi:Icc-related predicted phosphoesterase